MEYLVWIGPRESDIKFCSLFSESICYFSDKNKLSLRKADIYGSDFISFILEKMEKIISLHDNAKFIFYNPKIAYQLPKELREYVICLNSKFILELLSDKIYTRYWLGNYVPVLPSIILDAPQLSFDILTTKIGNYSSFVVQQNRSSGGFGTYCLENTDIKMLEWLKTSFNELFIISPRISNCISLNVNAIIYEDEIRIFHPSLQIIEENQKRLLYHGADYKAAKMLSNKIITQIKFYSNKLLHIVQKLNYRGIIGIDYIIDNDKIYFQEINPRYQASSFLINQALKDSQMLSLSEMNINAFYNLQDTIDTDFYTFAINKSFYKFIYKSNSKHYAYIQNRAQQNEYVHSICFDGWKNSKQVEEDAYCYSIIFSTNIVSPNMDGGFNLYSNITGEEDFLQKELTSDIGLKIALLNQGCVIDNQAAAFFKDHGIIKKATFSAIDFKLKNGLLINAPVNIKFTDFSPFVIKIDCSGHPVLNYYDTEISEISVEMEPEWNNRMTQNAVPYGRIAYLSVDRLRIKHESVCEFKKEGVGCSFCGIPLSRYYFNDKDIEEVINYLVPQPSYRHILIGGGSGDASQEYKHILKITHLIHKTNPNLPIYLMSIPPENLQVLEKYKLSGITEVAFNIEIWDRKLAERLMPGKGKILLTTYLAALKESTKLWGKNGNVRTALIVGLNNSGTLLNGIEQLCQDGIQPMLSVFRPMPTTKLSSLVPPSNSNLLDIYSKAQQICEKYDLTLGPMCNDCKNNMLAI